MRTYTDRELRALVILLGDEDARTARIARENLEKAGTPAMPFLDAGRRCPDPIVRGRARLLWEEMRTRRLEDRIAEYARTEGGEVDLEEGLRLIAEYGFPDLDPQEITAGLDFLAHDLREQLEPEMSMEDQVRALCRYLGEEQEFRGGEYYDADNSYLNRVLERRIGTQALLSAVYILVGQRLGLPIAGVGLPGHFIVQAALPEGPMYIDPHSGGRIWSKSDCFAYLRQIGIGPMEQYLVPTPPRRIVARMLVNLVNIYTQVGDEVKAQQVHKFLEVLTAQD